jgi:hypothetical protein
MGWYGLDSSGSGEGPVEGSYEHGNEMLGNSRVAAQLAASQEGLTSMELVSLVGVMPDITLCVIDRKSSLKCVFDSLEISL